MLFIILCSALIASVASQTCANDQSPCLKTQVSTIDIYFCPEGMACLKNTTCCLYADIQTGSATTVSPTTTTCVDKLNPTTGVSDCPRNANLCNDSVYYQLMTEQCPKTCNRCSGGSSTNNGGTSSSCVDKVNPSTGRSECAEKAYLCTNTVYRSLMQDQCPKTCGFC